DELRRVADDDVEAVELPNGRARVVAIDLDELELELGALRHRRRRGQVGELALGDDDEVVEVHVRLPLEEEAPLRQRLELDQAPSAGTDERGCDRRGELDAIRLRARARGQ